MVGPPWIELVPAHPTDAQLDWDLGNLEARLTPKKLFVTFLGPFLSSFCGVVGSIVLLGGVHCHQVVLLL